MRKVHLFAVLLVFVRLDGRSDGFLSGGTGSGEWVFDGRRSEELLLGVAGVGVVGSVGHVVESLSLAQHLNLSVN